MVRNDSLAPSDRMEFAPPRAETLGASQGRYVVADKAELDRERERQRLLNSLTADRQPRSNKERITRLLAQFPKVRDSDDFLWEKMVRTHASQWLDSEDRIYLRDMKRLPSRYDSQRVRAHIQNTLGLFLPSPAVADGRRVRQDLETERYSPQNKNKNSRILNVHFFCDESSKSKSDRFLVVGSVWLQPGCEPNLVEARLSEIKAALDVSEHELHFSKLKAQRLAAYIRFFDEILKLEDIIAFRAVVLDQQRTRRSVEKKVEEAYLSLVHRTIEFDIKARRTARGRWLHCYKDADGDFDDIAVERLRSRMRADLAAYNHASFPLVALRSVDSAASGLVQVADLFTGAVARAWRRKSGFESSENPKDVFADHLCDRLSLNRIRPQTPVMQDFTMVELLG